MGLEGVKILGDGSHVFVDGPLVVIQDDDEALGGFGDVVEGLQGGAAGEGGISCDGNYVSVFAFLIAGCGHSECGGEGGSSMSGSIGIVLGLGAEEKAIEALILTNGVDLVSSASEHLVDVALVGDVEDKFVLGSMKDAVKGDREFDDPQIGTEMTSCVCQGANQGVANLGGESFELIFVQLFDIIRRFDTRQECGIGKRNSFWVVY